MLKYKNTTVNKLNTIKHKHNTFTSTIVKESISGGIFRTQSDIQDGKFLRK